MTASIATLVLCGGTVKQRLDKFKVFSSRSAPPIRLGFPTDFEVVGHGPLPPAALGIFLPPCTYRQLASLI